MSNESFYIPDHEDDLAEYTDSLPNKSEVIRRLLREHKNGEVARANERIAEIEEELEAVEEEIEELEARKNELKSEKARLAEQREKRDDVATGIVELAEELVTIEPDIRETAAKRIASDVPAPLVGDILETVDIHYYDADGGVSGAIAHGDMVIDDLDEDGVDTKDLVGGEGAVSIPDGHPADDVLQGLTTREWEAIQEVADGAR